MRHRAQPHVPAHPLVADDRDCARVERALEIFQPCRAIRVRLRRRRLWRRRARFAHPGLRDRPHSATTGLRSISAISGCVHGDSRDGFQQRDDRVDVDAGLTADAAQNLSAAKLREHRRRLTPANRRQRKRGVLHHFDEHSAEPHHHHRAESFVAERPRDQLDALPGHRLHGDALEARVARLGGQVAANSLERVAHCDLVAEIQLDAADIALVTHIRRQHFQHHRESDPRRRPHRVVGRSRNLRHHHWQAERMQDSLAFDFRENRPSAGTSRRYYR